MRHAEPQTSRLIKRAPRDSDCQVSTRSINFDDRITARHGRRRPAFRRVIHVTPHLRTPTSNPATSRALADLAIENAGRQVRLVGVEDGPQVWGHNRDADAVRVRKCLQVSVDRGEGREPLVATFGGIPLRRQQNAVLRDRDPVLATSRREEPVRRFLAGRCELCGQADEVRVHQIRKLAGLDKPGQPDPPEWVQVMTRRRRKTLVVCEACHASIHLVAGEPGELKGSRRFGRGPDETEWYRHRASGLPQPPAVERQHETGTR